MSFESAQQMYDQQEPDCQEEPTVKDELLRIKDQLLNQGRINFCLPFFGEFPIFSTFISREFPIFSTFISREIFSIYLDVAKHRFSIYLRRRMYKNQSGGGYIFIGRLTQDKELNEDYYKAVWQAKL